jgi:hypothetical protein
MGRRRGRRKRVTALGTIPATTLRCGGSGLKPLSTAAVDLLQRDTEIDIWRAAQLMLKRYGEQGTSRAPCAPTSSRLKAIMIAP